MTVAVIYSFEARRGKAEELRDLLRQGRDVAATVEGFEGFDVYQGKDDPHRFVMVETWASTGAHQSHFEKNVKASGVLARVETLMAAPFDVAEPYYILC